MFYAVSYTHLKPNKNSVFGNSNKPPIEEDGSIDLLKTSITLNRNQLPLMMQTPNVVFVKTLLKIIVMAFGISMSHLIIGQTIYVQMHINN